MGKLKQHIILDIPGFYYDETKKKYFKIEKSTWNSGDNPYKEDTLKKRKLLEKVEADVNSVQHNYKLFLSKFGSFPALMYQREIGLFPMSYFSKVILLKQGSQVKLNSSGKTSNFFNSKNTTLKCVSPHPNKGVILHLQSAAATSNLLLCKNFRMNHKGKLSLTSQRLHPSNSIRNVRSLRWFDDSGQKLCLLEYISDEQDLEKSYLTFLSDPDESNFNCTRHLVNNFGTLSSFLPIPCENKLFCCYNSAVEVHSFDNSLTRLKWKNFSHKDRRKFLCVELLGDQTSSHTVLVGSRDHGIDLYDVRQARLSSTLHLSSSDKGICNMMSMPDNDYQFISASFDGNIRLWDVRNNKANCLTYHNGIVNSFTTPPLCVDKMSTYLLSSGENCAIHVWNLKCGDLIKLINPKEHLHDNQLSLDYKLHPFFCSPRAGTEKADSLDIVAFSTHHWIYYSSL